MDSHALTFGQLPHQPKLFLEYLDHFENVKSFYVHPPTMPAVARAARKLDYPGERRAEVTSILRKQNIAVGAGAETLANVDRLENGAVAVVSGQQVGLFSGPAYSVYKALTAVQIAEELTREGIPAVPVFWMATEDHDLDEVRHATWFEQGKLVRFELPLIAETGRPVGRIPLGAKIEPLVQEAAELLANQGSDLLAQYLIESYRPEDTYGSAFGKLFAQKTAQIICRTRCRTCLPAGSFRSGIARAGRCLGSQAVQRLLAPEVRSLRPAESVPPAVPFPQ